MNGKARLNKLMMFVWSESESDRPGCVSLNEIPVFYCSGIAVKANRNAEQYDLCVRIGAHFRYN